MSPSATDASKSASAGKSASIPDVGFVPMPQVSGEWTVDKVLDAISEDKPVQGSSSPVGYFHLLERLKTTKREGWRRFGINR